MSKHRDIIPILCDTREQNPLCFAGLDCTVESATVPVFDYALKGDEQSWSVERKSVPDLISSITTKDGKRLELNKIAKAREVFADRPIVYVVEGDYIDLSDLHKCYCTRGGEHKPWRDCDKCESMGYIGYDYSRRRFEPGYVFRCVSIMQFEWKVQVLFTGSRLASACAIESLLRRRYNVLKIKGLIDEHME